MAGSPRCSHCLAWVARARLHCLPCPGGTLSEIDTNTAEVLSETPLKIGPDSSALAVAWWGGSFYIFTTNGIDSTAVTRYNPDDMSIVDVVGLAQTVVGAGVSTCAPQTPDAAP